MIKDSKNIQFLGVILLIVFYFTSSVSIFSSARNDFSQIGSDFLTSILIHLASLIMIMLIVGPRRLEVEQRRFHWINQVRFLFFTSFLLSIAVIQITNLISVYRITNSIEAGNFSRWDTRGINRAKGSLIHMVLGSPISNAQVQPEKRIENIKKEIKYNINSIKDSEENIWNYYEELEYIENNNKVEFERE